jgi:putative ABC transport system substrate-binding protein
MTQVSLFALLALVHLAAPLAAEAQPAGKLYQIGMLSVGSPPISTAPPNWPAVAALHELGYVEGRNVIFHWRWAANRFDALPGLAADLVRLDVNIILTFGTDAAKAAKRATETIPIVFFIGSDPVKHGLVTSLSRPGGNVTGITTTSIDLSGKLLQTLKETIPVLTKYGVLWEGPEPPPPSPYRSEDARRLGLEAHFFETTGDGLGQAFEAARRARVGALLVSDSPVFTQNRTKIGSLGLQHRLPTVAPKVSWHRRVHS